jgi:hypothetical protein
MNKCKEIQSMFIDALYSQLTPDQAAQFEEHRESCAKCAARYVTMAETVRLMGRRKRTGPGQEFWDGYWTRLSQRIEREGGLQAYAPAKRTIIPAWMLRIAAVFFLVGVGVLIGKYYFGRPEKTPIANRQTPSAQRVMASEQRASDFLERSETILLGLVNYDPKSESPETLNLARQKQASQQLVREASYLQTQLKQPENRKLHKLVSDLQVILVQIANLEEREDIPEIELVKGGVDRKGILLKINLEQMRMVSEEAQESRVKPQSGKSGI